LDIEPNETGHHEACPAHYMLRAKDEPVRVADETSLAAEHARRGDRSARADGDT
jgi:hypothetical protein